MFCNANILHQFVDVHVFVIAVLQMELIVESSFLKK